jgi:hypothetical protein
MIFALLWIGIVLMPIRMRIKHSILMPDPDPIPQQFQFTCFIFHVSVIGVNCKHFQCFGQNSEKSRLWIRGFDTVITDMDPALFVSDIQDANNKVFAYLLRYRTF